eukprot:m.386200 g.386200  ORF g.386200 m.386200 type:complete len:158 (+) comp56297_c0_seq18:289-762(+)
MSASQEDPSERVAEVTALADEIKRLIRLPEQGIAGASEIVARASTLHQKIMEFVEQIKAALIHHQRVKDTRFITQTRRLYVSSNHMYELAQKNFTVEVSPPSLILLSSGYSLFFAFFFLNTFARTTILSVCLHSGLALILCDSVCHCVSGSGLYGRS